jgi:hypothetical protein
MTRSVSAELLLLRRRAITWILLAIWTALATFFSYALPYVEYVNGDLEGGPGRRRHTRREGPLLPPVTSPPSRRSLL